MKSYAQYCFYLLLLLLPSIHNSYSATQDGSSYSGEKLSHYLVGTTKLGLNPEWLKLLHYEQSWSKKYLSRITDPDFFLDEAGATDPETELLATINAFVDPRRRVARQGVMIHPICKYPARFSWIKERVRLPEFKVNCSDYERFFELIFPEKVWYVFSSYYLNNPSSSFGHSLLRFERKPRPLEKHNVLLDHGVNFAAIPDTSNSILYAIKGLSGYFEGRFSVLPFFFKVREYSDYESRDLWSYQINLTLNERVRLVQHLWELEGTHFNYYFFSENCSYQLLALLEVAKPNLNILGQLPPWVIPSETVRVLTRSPDLVVDELFRPSLYRKFRTRQDNLNNLQKRKLHRLIATRDTSSFDSKFSEQESAQIYDAALDFTEYLAPSLLRKEDRDNDLEIFKFKLLKARASIHYSSQDLEVPIPLKEKPDLGHGTGRTSFGGMYNNNQQATYYLIEQRFAYHDFLDELTGYPPHALIEFMHIKAKIIANTERERIELDHFSLIKIQSLKSFSFLEPEPSWMLELGASQEEFRSCPNCQAAFAEVGIGLAQFLGGDKHSLAGFISLPLYVPLIETSKPAYSLNISVKGIFQLNVGNRLLLVYQNPRFQQEKISGQQFSLEFQHQNSSKLAISSFVNISDQEESFGSKISYYY